MDLLGVKVFNRMCELFLVITTENKRSDRHFKYIIIVQNLQLTSEMLRWKSVKALVFIYKRIFCKTEKGRFSIMFGER